MFECHWKVKERENEERHKSVRKLTQQKTKYDPLHIVNNIKIMGNNRKEYHGVNRPSVVDSYDYSGSKYDF